MYLEVVKLRGKMVSPPYVRIPFSGLFSVASAVRANKKFSKMENLYDLESDIMANTSAVYARIDNDLKENAEEILAQLGITPSSAIQMLYSQIVLQRGLPFEAKLPYRKPVAWGALTPEEQEAELQKGIDSLKSGKTYTVGEIDAEIKKEFGI